MNIGLALFFLIAAFLVAVGFGVGAEVWKDWRGLRHTYRLTISKPDDDRVIATAELTNADERQIERLAPLITGEVFAVSIRELEKDYAD